MTQSDQTAKYVFVVGFGSVMSTEALTALKSACERGDARLRGGSTTVPPPLMCVQGWPVEAACAVGYAGWQGGDAEPTVGKVEEYFAVKCFQADQVLGDPCACRFFLNWFDDNPRHVVLPELAKWCGEVLSMRNHAESTSVITVPAGEIDPFA